MVSLGVVDVELQRPALVRLDQREQVLALVKHRVRADDAVRVAPQPRDRRRRVGLDVEDVPDVLVGALEGAEADADSEEALAAPRRARGDEDLADLERKTDAVQFRNTLGNLKSTSCCNEIESGVSLD